MAKQYEPTLNEIISMTPVVVGGIARKGADTAKNVLDAIGIFSLGAVRGVCEATIFPFLMPRGIMKIYKWENSENYMDERETILAKLVGGYGIIANIAMPIYAGIKTNDWKNGAYVFGASVVTNTLSGLYETAKDAAKYKKRLDASKRKKPKAR